SSADSRPRRPGRVRRLPLARAAAGAGSERLAAGARGGLRRPAGRRAAGCDHASERGAGQPQRRLPGPGRWLARLLPGRPSRGGRPRQPHGARGTPQRERPPQEVVVVWGGAAALIGGISLMAYDESQHPADPSADSSEVGAVGSAGAVLALAGALGG